MTPLHKVAIAALAVWLHDAPLAAQQPSSPPAPCTCRADLDMLAAKIERNYVAWHLEFAGTPREQEFRQLVRQLQPRADRADDAECVDLLREVTGWFRDGHLFVIELPTVSREQAQALSRLTPTREVDERRMRDDWERRRDRLDPVEGIWYAPGYRMAVVPDTGHDGRRFVGIVLASDSSLWTPGQVKAMLTRNADGSYRTVLRADDHSLRHVEGRIYRNLLLNISPMTWGREYPLAPHEKGMLHPVDPSRPTLRLVGDDAVVVSVPSHDPSYRAVLDTLVRAHRDALATRPFLVIDIRGDLGGGSMTTSPLVPWLVTAERRAPIGPQGTSAVVSSPDNIRYFQRGWNPDSIVQRMSAAPGKVMPLMRTEALGMPFPNAGVLPKPARVGVLMDRGVASAGEAFVLQARQSTKVTLFGENTNGMIDYQSVMIVRLACRDRGLLLGYPMIAASATLPRDGLNAAGIPPDVRLDPRAPDVVHAVLEALRSGAATRPD